MEHVVTITRQGQLTIPAAIRKHFRISGSTKATVKMKGNVIVVEPKGDFWSLPGTLSSSIRLSDRELKHARETFSKKWAKRV
jgi:AbrB family looped-hinge helix DNA binding protein